MTSTLERILDETRATVAANKRAAPLGELMERSAEGQPRGFRQALERSGIGVIAEFKRRSPFGRAAARGRRRRADRRRAMSGGEQAPCRCSRRSTILRVR